jgi:hypothetical protein
MRLYETYRDDMWMCGCDNVISYVGYWQLLKDALYEDSSSSCSIIRCTLSSAVRTCNGTKNNLHAVAVSCDMMLHRGMHFGSDRILSALKYVAKRLSRLV